MGMTRVVPKVSDSLLNKEGTVFEGTLLVVN